VRHNQNAHALLGAQPLDECVELHAHADIDACGGFVQQQEFGLLGKRGGDNDALQLAS
jgi:hypothetical protein